MAQTGPLTPGALASLARLELPPRVRVALEGAGAAPGPTGVVVRVGGRPVGVALCGPHEAPGRPAEPGVAWLLAAWVEEEHAGGGLGRLLVRALATDLRRGGGVEALDARAGLLPRAVAGAPWLGLRGAAPRGFLTAVGFHPAYVGHPTRLRLDLTATVPAQTTTAPSRLRGRRRAGPAPCAASRSAQVARVS